MKNEVLHQKVEFTDMRALVEWFGETYKEKLAYSYRIDPVKGAVITKSFAQLRDDVRGLATELADIGCTGKKCVLFGKYSYEWVVMYFSVLSIGGILVPLDKDWQGADLAETASTAEADYVFCDKDLAEKADIIAQKVALKKAPYYLNAENDSENSVAGMIEAGKEKFAKSSDAYYNTIIDPMSLGLLVFTSGTTGKGKGVMLSQNAILSDMSDVVQYVDFGSKTLGLLPLHHTYGSSVMIVGHSIIGTEVYISSGLRYIMKELKEQQPEHLILVPLYMENFYRKILANAKDTGKYKTLFRMIKVSNFLRKFGIDLRRKFFKSVHAAFGGKVKMIISGGAPVNPDIIYFFESVGIQSLNGYGITECAPIIAVNRSLRSVPGSVGPVIGIDEVKIFEKNEDGEGEILVKGPNVMLGYYKDAKATADAFTEDGFFRTGDYGKLEGDVIFITGRKKNLIILSNGKNVYPEEIENELSATPGILEIIVYEGKSKRGMEHNAIVAEIYPDKEFLEKQGIKDAHAYFKPFISNYNKNAVAYKKITVIKIREEEFPKNTLRKILRFKIDMSIE